MSLELTFDLLPIVSAVIAVVGFFVPVVSVKYQKMAPDLKQLAYAGAVVGIAAVVTLLSYFGFLDVYSGEGWQYWVWTPVVDIGYGLLSLAGVYVPFNKVADRLPKKQ